MSSLREAAVRRTVGHHERTSWSRSFPPDLSHRAISELPNHGERRRERKRQRHRGADPDELGRNERDFPRSSGPVDPTPHRFFGNTFPSRPSKVTASKATRRKVPGPADGLAGTGRQYRASTHRAIG